MEQQGDDRTVDRAAALGGLGALDRDVVLVARSGSNQHVWVVRRSLSEIVGRGTPWTASLLVHDNVMH